MKGLWVVGKHGEAAQAQKTVYFDFSSMFLDIRARIVPVRHVPGDPKWYYQRGEKLIDVQFIPAPLTPDKIHTHLHGIADGVDYDAPDLDSEMEDSFKKLEEDLKDASTSLMYEKYQYDLIANGEECTLPQLFDILKKFPEHQTTIGVRKITNFVPGPDRSHRFRI